MSTTRKPWGRGQIAREYHAKHKYAPYTMVWNRTIEAEMMDVSLPKETRVLYAIRRYSWGNLSDWAVDAMPAKTAADPKPRPLTQEKLGQILNLSASSMSEACTFLREQGYLRKDHLYLFPEDKLMSLESTEDLESGSNSSNSHSPFLQFESSYLKENAELAITIAKLTEERNKFQDEARKITTEIRKAKRAILAAWRDFERDHPTDTQTENTGDTDDSETEGKPTRLCSRAKHEQVEIGETKANCTSSHVLESDSDSFLESRTAPPPPPLESESAAAKNPNDSIARDPVVKTIKGLKTSGRRVGQSVQQPATDRPTPAPRHQEILGAIPPELFQRLRDTPTTGLLDRIDQKLGHAPLSGFTERIRARWETITSLGILQSLADDVNRAWKVKSQQPPPLPAQTERKKSVFEEAAELQRRKYGIE